VLGHTSPAITLSAHAFAQAEHDVASRERMDFRVSLAKHHHARETGWYPSRVVAR
jgi:hypothetical protein